MLSRNARLKAPAKASTSSADGEMCEKLKSVSYQSTITKPLRIRMMPGGRHKT